MKNDDKHLPNPKRAGLAYAIAHALHGHPLRGRYFYPRH